MHENWNPFQYNCPVTARANDNYTGMTLTVQLYCPINAQIGPVDNQSDFENFIIVLIKSKLQCNPALRTPA